MTAETYVMGEIRHCDTPDWRPLEALLGSDELCGHFMWMGDVELYDGTVLNAYKHRWTRRYLHLDAGGRAWWNVASRLYQEVDLHRAVKAVFETWDCCDPTPNEKKALRVALRRLRPRAA